MHRRTWLTIAGVMLSPVMLYLALHPMSGCYKGCPEDRHEFCARNGNRDCGDVTASNLCGEVQTLNCGQCYGPDVCGGKGVPGVCSGCTTPTPIKDCNGGWCKIPAGCFNMGAHPNDPCDVEVYDAPPPHTTYGRETLHKVALTHRFVLMDAEVTQEAFKALMGYNPAKNINVPTPAPAGMPVEYISWHEAAAYANALSAKKGLTRCYACTGSGRFASCDTAAQFTGAKIYECPGYRLPTEAEWEYAFRAGSEWPLHNLLNLLTDCMEEPKLAEIAWCCPAEGVAAYHRPVKAKLANAWGLHDMAGNVFEWCHDWGVDNLGKDKATNPWGAASGRYRSLRSSAFNWTGARFFRASVRRLEEPKHVCSSVGVRLARTIGEGNL